MCSLTGISTGLLIEYYPLPIRAHLNKCPSDQSPRCRPLVFEFIYFLLLLVALLASARTLKTFKS